MKPILLASLICIGCYDPHPQNGVLACSAEGACPRGYHCVAQRCYDQNAVAVDLAVADDLAVASDLAASDLAANDLSANDLSQAPVDGGADLRPDGFCNQPCSPPPDTCSDGGLLHVSAAPSCDVNGDCVFTASTQTCVSPPPSACAAATETDYDPAGSCAGGSCGYPAHEKSCSSGCAPSGDVCAGDPCAGNNCATQTPSSSCSGLTFTQYSSDTCNGASGSAVCVQHQTVSDCSGTNPCVTYGCDSSSGCTTSNKPNYLSNCSSPSNGFCLDGTCTARIVTVAVTPLTADVHAGASRSFGGSASSNDTQDSSAVTWSLNPMTGSLSMVMANMVQYGAPAGVASPTAVSLIATSAVDSTKSGSSALTLYPAVSVSAITPGSANLHTGKTTSLAATLGNLAPSDGGNGTFTATHGTLSAAGCSKSGGSSSCSATYTAGATGADSVTLTSGDQATSQNSVTLTVFAAISVSAPAASVHVGKTLSFSASLGNLSPSDSGNASFSATSGSFGAVSCVKTGGSSTCSANYTAPSSSGNATVTITSTDDSGAKTTATITVVPAVTLTLDRSSVDLLAFAAPEQTATVTATLGNLLPGDSNVVTATPGANVAVTAAVTLLASSAAITLTPLSQYDFAASTSAPPVTTFTVAAAAEATATTSLTVNLHAWINESALVAAKLGNGLLRSVGINASGDVLVGGEDTSSPPQPRAAFRNHSGGAWSSAYSSTTAGSITSVDAADDGSFLMAGVQGTADGNGNQPLVVFHYTTAGGAGANRAPAASAGHDLGGTGYGGPRIVSSAGFKYLSYNLKGTTCAGGSKAKSTVLYNATNNLDATFSAANVYTYGSEVPASSSGDSCPLTPFETSNVATGLVMNSGGQLWVGGFADCGLTDSSGNGCNAVANGNGGAAATTIGSGVWRSYWGPFTSASVAQPSLRRGYDDSLLSVAGQGNSNIFYYDTGNPPTVSGTATLINSSDVGHAIAGSATGGAPWAGSQRDLFVIHSAFLSYRLSWLLGTTERIAPAPSSGAWFIVDVLLVHTANGYEGWVVGEQTDSGGSVTDPFAAHLF